MKKEYKLWLWIILWFFVLLIIFYSIWKKDQNDKLEELWISNEQAENIKNEINSIEEKNKSDTLSEEEINFFKENWLKEDVNRGLFYIYDKYQWDSKMIYFKKENWDWKWSILLWNWDDLGDDKYDNPNSIYNWYVIKQDKTKEIFEKLRGFSK